MSFHLFTLDGTRCSGSSLQGSDNRHTRKVILECPPVRALALGNVTRVRLMKSALLFHFPSDRVSRTRAILKVLKTLILSQGLRPFTLAEAPDYLPLSSLRWGTAHTEFFFYLGFFSRFIYRIADLLTRSKFSSLSVNTVHGRFLLALKLTTLRKIVPSLVLLV